MELTCAAILFDLDGVLVDSNTIVERHWRLWAERRGLPIDEILAVHHGRPTVETVRQFAPEIDAVAEARAKERVEADDTDGLTIYAGAFRLLTSLPRECWAIATSGTRRTATIRLQHVGLPIPDIFVTADDIQRGKPAPDPYLLAARGLGVPPGQCIVIEDAPAGIESGKAAGARVVAVASTSSRQALAGADAVVARLDDLQLAVKDGKLVLTFPAI
ncbi:HAD-IA family hydrolase [Planctomicrobium sp. SH664]|uniref:HAD-IA family hydrolase n=1 Tax=Planctomicrobium sp. SH664 TaxID=3448125 RepID=UPI003F5C9DA2